MDQRSEGENIVADEYTKLITPLFISSVLSPSKAFKNVQYNYVLYYVKDPGRTT